MLHFPKQNIYAINFDVVLFNGVQPRTGETANLNIRFLCLDNSYYWDFSTLNFAAIPVTLTASLSIDSGMTHRYYYSGNLCNCPRGHYRAIITDTVTGEKWHTDYTVGLKVTRTLAYSAVYDGTNLTLSAWIEEDGLVQTDYNSMSSVQVLDSSGAAVATGLTPTGPTVGVFKISQAVALSANTNYIFDCQMVCPGPATKSNLTFPLRVGIARP